MKQTKTLGFYKEIKLIEEYITIYNTKYYLVFNNNECRYFNNLKDAEEEFALTISRKYGSYVKRFVKLFKAVFSPIINK